MLRAWSPGASPTSPYRRRRRSMLLVRRGHRRVQGAPTTIGSTRRDDQPGQARRDRCPAAYCSGRSTSAPRRHRGETDRPTRIAAASVPGRAARRGGSRWKCGHALTVYTVQVACALVGRHRVRGDSSNERGQSPEPCSSGRGTRQHRTTSFGREGSNCGRVGEERACECDRPRTARGDARTEKLVAPPTGSYRLATIGRLRPSEVAS